MSTGEERLEMAAAILAFEARRDKRGRLAVYKLPEGDGGGRFEVAGINERYHPEEAYELAELIEAGRHEEAEQRALEIIAAFTDVVASWTRVTGCESYLRDCAFNRGPRGAARILQRALGLPDDGAVGPKTRAAVLRAEADPRTLLKEMRAAREQYERDVARRSEGDKFWKGLVNRWNGSLEVALRFLTTAARLDEDDTAGLLGDFHAAEAVIGRMSGAARGASAPASLPGPRSATAGDEVAENQPVAIKALRLGSAGPMVRAWQSFLLGRGLDPGGLDGEFGDKTDVATRQFQRLSGLSPDGVAGRQTLLAAMQLGFEFIEEPAADTSGSNFPPRPDFPPLLSTAARQAVFGAFDFVHDPKPTNRENIRILGDWEQDNIVSVPIPQLRLALGPNAPSSIRFHRLAGEQLAGLWADWEAAGLLDRVLSYDGGFVPRFIRGSMSKLSNHAFGTAFDINARDNGLGVRPALVGKRGSVRELVVHANRRGFYWGGHFGSRPDGMHFEIARLVDAG